MLLELRSFIGGLPDHLNDVVHQARQRVEVTVKLIEDDREGSESVQIADGFGDWLIGYFQLGFLPAATLFPQAS